MFRFMMLKDCVVGVRVIDIKWEMAAAKVIWVEVRVLRHVFPSPMTAATLGPKASNQDDDGVDDAKVGATVA